MDNERLKHQIIRDGNYEPLDSDEAKAVATNATALLSRPEASGSASLSFHRSAYNNISYDIRIRGWDTEPPKPLDELGGLNLNQLQAVLQRAIDTGGRYLRSPRSNATSPTATTTPETNAALERLRKRLREKREGTDE